jgi:hypothetical protein
MLGVNLLVRLGRQVLAGPIAGAGLLPASYYRHLVLAAMADEDFSGALDYLKWAADPLLAQILVLRLRLLAGEHRRRLQALEDLLEAAPPRERLAACQALITEESRALELLAGYEARALGLTAVGLGKS